MSRAIGFWIIIGLGLVISVMALFPDIFAPENPNLVDADRILAAPSTANPLGTDEVGADILSRLIHATQLDLAIAAGSVSMAVVLALPAGLLAGYQRGPYDALLTAISSSLLAFPIVLFAVLIVASFGASLATLVLVLAIVFFPRFFVLIRGQTMSLREREYVLASKAIGAGGIRIVFQDIVPNILGPLSVMVPQLMAVAILVEAGLSFVGLGVQPPQVTWGTILLTSKGYFTLAPWYPIAAGIVVTAAVAYFLALGDLVSRHISQRG